MRIKKIFINGFGSYHEKALNLNKSITVFKGSNEAGKTTIMQFVRTVFFGFQKPSKSQPKNEWFVPVAGGRHGGYIEIENDLKSNYRIERHLDGTRETVSVSDTTDGEMIVEGEHFLGQLLGGIDRKVFEQKYAFGINDLGNSDDFDFNQKLYDVGLGVKGLTAFLEQIGKRRKKLLVLGESVFGTNSTALDKNEKRIQEIISKVDKYIQYQTERQDFEKKRDDVDKKLKELRLKKQLQQAIPYWTKLQTSKNNLKNFEKYKCLSENAENLFVTTNQKIKSETENLQKAQNVFNEYENLSATLIDREEILQDEGHVESLRDDLKGFRSDVKNLNFIKEKKNSNERQLEGQIKELNNEWTENDLVGFDSSETMIEQVKKSLEASEALDSNNQGNIELSRYHYWILAGFLSLASLGLFFENVIERFVVLLISGISILLLNIWSSKKSRSGKNVSAQSEFKFKWEEFKKDNSFPMPVSLDTATSFIDRVRNVKRIQENLDAERKNIASLEKNISDFSDRAAQLAKIYILSNTVNQQAEPASLADQIIEKLAEVKRKHQDRENNKFHSQKEAKNIEKINETLKSLQGDFQDLLNQADCNSKADFEIYLGNHKKFKTSETDSEKAEEDIRNFAGPTQSIEDFKSHLKEFSESETEIDFGRIDDEILTLEEDLKSIDEALVLNKNDMNEIQSQNELQELQLEKAFLIKELNEQVEDWCKLTIAEDVLKEVQKKLQSEKQPSVIKLAEKYFQNITSGQYTNIYVDNENINDPINVLQNDHLRKNPFVLSGGTKDQLFLSMRLGEIVNYTKSHKVESLPVIFDDILVNSDFERSNKIIDTIAEISKHNQIIYFTFNPVVVETFSNLGNKCEIIEL